MSESLFTNLANGFSVAATPENLLFGIIGVVLEPQSVCCPVLARRLPSPCFCP